MNRTDRTPWAVAGVALLVALGLKLQTTGPSPAPRRAAPAIVEESNAAAHEPAHAHAAMMPAAGLDLSRTAEFDFDPPVAGTYRLPVIRPAADGAVLDSAGNARTLHELYAGRIVLLSFIYTRCTDANGCPLATAVLYRIFGASQADAELAANLRLVSLSFDPEHDTPEVMAGYRDGAGPQWADGAEWLDLTTASEAELQPILNDYDQLARRRVDDAGRPTDVFGHQLRAYLIDRQQRIRNIYGLGFMDPRLLVADVQTLLAEERGAAH